MKKLLCMVCTIAVLLSGPRAMAFCYEPQPRLVCAEYFNSKAVVKATLLRGRAIHDKGDPEGILAHIYTLTVNEALHGQTPGEIQVYDGNDSGRVTFDWIRGKDYLLFLDYVPFEHAWAVDGCGNSGPLAKAQRALAEIGAIKSAHGDGIISGLVVNGSSGPLGVVHLKAVGSKGAYQAVSDDNGKFSMQVPPGQYQLVDHEGTLSFQEYDLSYEDPMKIHIESGGCAQVQVVVTKSPP
jgi:hypothetical protein